MKTNILTAVLGTTFLFTGILAFFLPERFFDALGTYYGTFNLHFVKDAGISFFSSGCLLLASLRIRPWRVPFTIGGSMFIVLHGLFHTQMLITGMFPTGSDVAKEIALIITPAALTALLVMLRVKENQNGDS